MILTFGNEQTLLDKLSDSDRELAARDLILFGMYCIKEVDGVARRVDVRHVELRNGRIHWQTKIELMSTLAATPCATVFVREQKRIAAAASGLSGAWLRLWREALCGESSTSGFQIWKKQDPGAI